MTKASKSATNSSAAPDAKAQQRNLAFRTLHYYWQPIKKYKWYSLGLFISTPIVVFIRDILGPLIFANMLQAISDGIPDDQIISTLLPPAVLYLALYIINSIVISELRLYWTWRMELLSMYDLSRLCFDTITAQSMQFHNDRFSGSLVSQVNKFTGAFERLVDGFVWNFWYMLWVFIFVFIIMLSQAPLFAVLLICLVGTYALFSGLSYRKIAYYNEQEAAAANKQTGQLADAITNITSVKSYAQEPHEHHRFAVFLKKTLAASFQLMHVTIKRDMLFSGVNIGIVCLLLVFMMGGKTWFGLNIATLILIINYAQRVMGELWDINHIFKDLNRVFGDAKDMTEILDMPDDVVDEPHATQLTVPHGSIDFQQITFQHKDAAAPIFHDFNLTIRPGESVGLVGVSGSGKTTLTRLLLRFADVATGEITIDGYNIRYVTQASLRQNIAYVPQETALFHRSIADNIAYARPKATLAEIQRAAQLANAHEFIQTLPNQYDTLVGERGIKLSGGQRQRIAIARAILKDAPILVLDEATSALDSESEALIQDALNHLMKGRTSLVIAHRLSTVANLDRIIVLQDGQIVEQGTHTELLAQHGPYAKLWQRQSGGFLNHS